MMNCIVKTDNSSHQIFASTLPVLYIESVKLILVMLQQGGRFYDFKSAKFNEDAYVRMEFLSLLLHILHINPEW